MKVLFSRSSFSLQAPVMLTLGLAALLCAAPASAPGQAAIVPAVAKAAAAPASATSPHATQTIASISGRPLVPPQKSGKGLNDGIHVHGYWTIDVTNPDGTVTAHREFENSIQTPGATFLASLLAGNNASGGLSILLNGSPTGTPPLTTAANTNGAFLGLNFTEPGPCAPMPSDTGRLLGPTGGGGTTCLITTSSTSTVSALLPTACVTDAILAGVTTPCSLNLTVTAPTIALKDDGNGDTATITLGGSVTTTAPASGSGYVNDVETIYVACDNSTSPNACVITSPAAHTVAINFLTARTLDGVNGDPAKVQYTPGQVINVSVTISFQ
jgi:hypothetical protein